MKRIAFLFIASLFLILSITGLKIAIAKETATYQDLLERAKNQDESVDFNQLRLLYTEADDYAPTNTFPQERSAMIQSFNNKQFDDALKQALSILKKNYFLLEPHYTCAIIYETKGDMDNFNKHMFFLKGMTDSIMKSGNGQSPDTAFKVISVDEEYFLLSTMGFRPIEQRTLNIEGHNYDELIIADQSGNKASIYFNVDPLFRYYDRVFRKKTE